MAYTPTKAKSTGASGKYKTFKRGESGTKSGTGNGKAKEKSSYAQVESARTGGGSSGGYTLPGGAAVEPKAETSYPAVAAEREKLVKEAAAAGTATTKQEAELAAKQKQQVRVAVDYKAVEEYNKTLKEQGIETAEEYFKRVRAGAEQSEPPNYREVYTMRAPRTVARGETMSTPEAPVYVPPGEPFNTQISKKETPQTKAKEFTAFLEKRSEETPRAFTGLPAPVAFVGLGAAGFVSGVVKAGQGVGRFITETLVKKFPKSPAGVPEYVAYDIVGGVIGGTAEFIGEGVSAVVTVNPYKIGEVAGEFQAYKTAGGAVKGLVKESAIAVNLPANAARLKAEITFKEAQASTPLDAGYEFSISSYAFPEGRKGVLVPPEFEGLGVRPQVVEGAEMARAAPELQTQLYPKKLGAGEYEAYLKTEGYEPITYKPSSFLELAKQEPVLAKELAKEAGQTVFYPGAPAFVRDLTPAERLKVAKEQAGIKAEVLQKTLPGYIPKAGKSLVILKDGKPVIVKTPGMIEIREPPLFAVEPLSAAIITLVQEREGITTEIKGGLRDFKRRSVEIGRESIQRSTKEPGNKNKPLILTAELRDVQYAPGVILTGVSILKPEPSSLPAYKIARKAIQEATAKPGALTRTRTAQQPATITEQIPEQRQAPILEQTTAPRLDFKNVPAQIIREKPRQTPPAFLDFKEATEEPKTGGLFTTLVRRRGKFQAIGTSPTEKAAQRLGELSVKETAAASFKVTSGGEALELAPSFGFTRSKRERGVILQPRERRIKTAGEKSEITFKGIRETKARKGRKRAFNLFGGL